MFHIAPTFRAWLLLRLTIQANIQAIQAKLNIIEYMPYLVICERCLAVKIPRIAGSFGLPVKRTPSMYLAALHAMKTNVEFS
jgi:hypothetical protein